MLNFKSRFAVASMVLSLLFTSSDVPYLYTRNVISHIKEASPQEGERLLHEGLQKIYAQDFQNALPFFQQALSIFQDVNNQYRQADVLFHIGQVYISLDNFKQGIKYYQKSLILSQKINYPEGKINALSRLGNAYNYISEHEQSVLLYNDALSIARDIGNQETIAYILVRLGWSYNYLSIYQQAIENYQEAIEIQHNLNNPLEEAYLLHALGWTYSALGRNEDAISLYQQSLNLFEDLENLNGQAFSLGSIAWSYFKLRSYESSIHYHQQALTIRESLGDLKGQAFSLGGLGSAYTALNRYQDAIQLHQQQLNFAQKSSNSREEAHALKNLGDAYLGLREYDLSSHFYQKSLRLYREINALEDVSIVLGKIGYLFQQKESYDISIIFYKQSVNSYEKIRRSNQSLEREFRESYTDSIASTYRTLADLLLKQGRVLEAQQVLDLLKIQELGDYFSDVRGNAITASGIEFWQPEQEILDQFNDRQQNIAELGQELTALRQVAENDRTAAEQQRIDELVNLEEALNRQFNDFLESDQILALVNQLSITTQRQALNPEDIAGLRETLGNLNAVLLYPMILEDRLELVIAIPNAPPLRRTVEVNREELSRTILEFRKVLQTPARNASIPAQKLYRWLIEPLEADFADADIDTIIYAPDGQLRYIPLAALHDGDQYLAERYIVNNITARSLMDLDAQPVRTPTVLAGAFADAEQAYPVQIGQRNIDFQGLPFAGVEVANLVATLSHITSFVDNDFSLAAVKSRLIPIKSKDAPK